MGRRRAGNSFAANLANLRTLDWSLLAPNMDSTVFLGTIKSRTLKLLAFDENPLLIFLLYSVK